MTVVDGTPIGPDEPSPASLLGIAEFVAGAHRAGQVCHDRCPGDETCFFVRRVKTWARLAADIVIDSHAAGDSCGAGCAGGDDCTRLGEAVAALVADSVLRLPL